ncbi:MAG: aldehyde dehydrogenase family protein [Gammaproteobacteria bacterium]
MRPPAGGAVQGHWQHRRCRKSSNIWTRDISVAHKLAKKIKAGMVRVNGGNRLDNALPFGGYKQSGWGREYGREGVEAYTEVKSVSVAL